MSYNVECCGVAEDASFSCTLPLVGLSCCCFFAVAVEHDVANFLHSPHFTDSPLQRASTKFLESLEAAAQRSDMVPHHNLHALLLHIMRITAATAHSPPQRPQRAAVKFTRLHHQLHHRPAAPAAAPPRAAALSFNIRAIFEAFSRNHVAEATTACATEGRGGLGWCRLVSLGHTSNCRVR